MTLSPPVDRRPLCGELAQCRLQTERGKSFRTASGTQTQRVRANGPLLRGDGVLSIRREGSEKTDERRLQRAASTSAIRKHDQLARGVQWNRRRSESRAEDGACAKDTHEEDMRENGRCRARSHVSLASLARGIDTRPCHRRSAAHPLRMSVRTRDTSRGREGAVEGGDKSPFSSVP